MIKPEFVTAFLFSFVLLAGTSSVHAHNPPNGWDADLTPAACSLGVDSGWEHNEEFDTMEPGEITVDVTIAVFHPEEEPPFADVLDAEPYLIHMQVISSHNLRMNDRSISVIAVQFGGQSVEPTPDPDWEDRSLPIVLLGGSEARGFVQSLVQGESPTVLIELSDSRKFEVSVSTKNFTLAFSMMSACRDGVSNSGLE